MKKIMSAIDKREQPYASSLLITLGATFAGGSLLLEEDSYNKTAIDQVLKNERKKLTFTIQPTPRYIKAGITYKL